MSPAKSTATLFTTWTKELNTNLSILVDRVQIPSVNHPKIGSYHRLSLQLMPQQSRINCVVERRLYTAAPGGMGGFFAHISYSK